MYEAAKITTFVYFICLKRKYETNMGTYVMVLTIDCRIRYALSTPVHPKTVAAY